MCMCLFVCFFTVVVVVHSSYVLVVAPLLVVGFVMFSFVPLVVLRFGYKFESCEANSPRSVQNQNPSKQRPVNFPTSPLVVMNRS